MLPGQGGVVSTDIEQPFERGYRPSLSRIRLRKGSGTGGGNLSAAAGRAQESTETVIRSSGRTVSARPTSRIKHTVRALSSRERKHHGFQRRGAAKANHLALVPMNPRADQQ